MGTKQLLNGGTASTNNIYYWSTSNVSVANDATTYFYRIANNGIMKQTNRLPVSGELRLSGTYVTFNHNGSLNVSMTISLNDGNSIYTTHNLHNEVLNEWGAFEIKVDIDESILANSIDFTISYTGESYGAVANLSAIVYYSNTPGSVSSEDFMNKAILYGLDSDRPVLGHGLEELS